MARVLLVCLSLVLILIPGSSIAQDAPSAAAAAPSSPATNAVAPAPVAYENESLPADPAAALLLASKANGLGDPTLKPWYLKAHYQTYDAQGKPAAKGVFEIYWAARDRYRVSYTSDTFSRTSYHTTTGDYIVGSAGSLPYREAMLWPEFMRTVSLPDELQGLQTHTTKSGDTSLVCISYLLAPEADAAHATYCFNPNRAVLRSSFEGGIGTVYNKTVLFQHRFVAGHVEILDGDQPVISMDVDTLRGMQQADISALEPPQGAVLDDGASRTELRESTPYVPGFVMRRYLIKPVPFDFPLTMKTPTKDAVLAIRVIIGRDGMAHNPEIMTAPDDPRWVPAVLRAITQERYRPYLVNGKPVDVVTTIGISFSASLANP